MKLDTHKLKATKLWKKKNGIVDEKPKQNIPEQPNRYESEEEEYDSEEQREIEQEIQLERELLELVKNREITTKLEFTSEKPAEIVKFNDEDDDRLETDGPVYFERPKLNEQHNLKIDELPNQESTSDNFARDGPMEVEAVSKLNDSKSENIDDWLEDLL